MAHDPRTERPDHSRPGRRLTRAASVAALALAFGLGGTVQAQAAAADSLRPAAPADGLSDRSRPSPAPRPGDDPVTPLGVRWQ